MEEDEEGFLYPVIDETKCINCGLCKKICSNNPQIDNKEETYIAINNNKQELAASTSGGMFSILANYVFNKNGIIFGVRYDKNLNVIHSCTKNKKDIDFFRRSKYVKSDLKDSYREVELFLKEDNYVLFTGTPCQCAGLRSYLMKDYDKLITCDIVCHSNSSPKIFNMFKQNVEKKYKSKITNIQFRNKEKYGWRSGENTIISFENGKKMNIQEYTRAFLNSLIDRPSCHSCKFCTPKRYSDFTIGDLWGIEKIQNDIVDDNTGISLLSVNTTKGKKIFEEIKNNMMFKKFDKELVWKYNHNNNIPYHKKRNEFFQKIKTEEINANNIIYYLKKYTKKPLYRRILGKCKRIIKKVISK